MRRTTQITISTNPDNEHREVKYQGKVLKSFSPYDDFAYTKAREYQEHLQHMSVDEFKELYPEFFL